MAKGKKKATKRASRTPRKGTSAWDRATPAQRRRWESRDRADAAARAKKNLKR